MTKNNKDIDKLITRIEKLRAKSKMIITEYEKSTHIASVPMLYELYEGVDTIYRAMRSALIDKKDSQVLME